MLKVLVVNIQSHGGGAETVLRNLTNLLSRDESGVHVDTLSKHEYSKSVPAGRIVGYFKFLRELRSRSRRYDFVVSGVEGLPFLLCLIALCGLKRTHLVMWLHCSPSAYLKFQTFKNRFAIRASLAMARNIICAAPAEADALRQNAKNAIYLPNIRQERANLGWINPARTLPRLAFVGSLAPLKQPLKAIEVLAALSDAGRTDFRLDIFGTGVLASQIDGTCQRTGLSHSVRLHGFVADPWSMIETGSLLLLPSLTEAMPMVVLEALDRGCVVISNTFKGYEFFDRHGGLFLGVDFSNIHLVVSTIKGALDWDRTELLARLSRSQSFLLEEFDNERSVRMMSDYLAALAAS